MRTLALIAGLLIAASGALWTLQGLGIVTWPQESFMIRQTQWVWYGAATVVAGLVLVAYSRRR